MISNRSAAVTPSVPNEDVDAVLAACRVLVALSAQSIAAVEDLVDVTQFRALVVVAARGSVSLVQLADATHLHMSRASRMCERLVGMGLMHRGEDPSNRRQVTLTLTPDGHQLVATVMAERRAAIEPILARLPRQRRAELVSVLQDFAAAAGEPADPDLWALGWTT